MESLVSLFKSDFKTIRQLEKKGSTLFIYSGGAFVLGLVLFLSMVLAFIGIPLMIIGVVLFFVSMLWMMKLGKQPVWHLFCPYCSGKNDVFKVHRQFDCDLCGRTILVDEHGQADPAEPVERMKNY